ncbi:hypothetical protein HAT86_12630 [Roseovarius gahaiensis]|uniref:Uncharacterized protein n=1 Tax=Roseovarius gahaiensis TaxID=2716691 RepID=A0A967EGR4_9RHOB|nr:hypothetical protein [Roseovarius gahaiensis]NHQ75301.1 hypothetical protein [Roseovarius gahaiensis]
MRAKKCDPSRDIDPKVIKKSLSIVSFAVVIGAVVSIAPNMACPQAAPEECLPGSILHALYARMALLS